MTEKKRNDREIFEVYIMYDTDVICSNTAICDYLVYLTGNNHVVFPFLPGTLSNYHNPTFYIVFPN